MKELEHHGSEAPGTRVLKSLLKKPGQGKQRTHKNRVVINEKVNEYFAADYIILIKEECCADYEEECDCCCQETEMIRVGNCKECRAELSRHLASGGGIDPRFDRNGGEHDLDVIGRRISGSEESQCEDEGEEEEEEYEEEVDDYEEEGESSEEQMENRGVVDRIEKKTPQGEKNRQQTETLSPPEGYKDVCDDDDDDADNNSLEICPGPVCGECNYYQQQQQQRSSDVEDQNHGQVATESETKSAQERLDESSQQMSDQAQQTTPDVHQRYLVETITMTTVTERRIVREISEEEPRMSIDQPDTISQPIEGPSLFTQPSEDQIRTELMTKEDEPKVPSKQNSPEFGKETPQEPSELSLTFKLGNSLVANSLKPNSAVRQLFPDPRFISPPPAPTKSVSQSNDEATDSDSSEAQRFLITTESLRLFDSVKRSKIGGNRSDSSESDSSTIKRTIERNALRRSLICKYDSSMKKKNLRGKDLTLEERIRQLTCVDQEEDQGDSASETQSIDHQQDQSQEFPIRTSPSGEERPRNDRVVRSNCQEHNSPPLHQHHHHHHNHQSAYRKITDLFGQKKFDRMPDLGLGDPANLMKDYSKSQISKMSSDARKQFLSSLAPLSCVASTGVDGRDDYYQISSKLSNRDSVGYNSDSSYSLEDIESVLRGEERNNKNAGGPPDVTRGTPTGTGPDPQDATTDELLAFVEQDKTRTERLKRRYDTEDVNVKNGETNGNNERQDGDNNDDNNDDEEDDELNDYGFNTRPAVRGIKPQFESSSEIVRQLRSRAIPTTIPDKNRPLNAPWPYYDAENQEKRVQFVEETTGKIVEGRDNTIKRINTMQRQIDDIYQTIAETAVSVQGQIDRGSYLESTLPRNLPRASIDQQNGHFHDPRVRIENTNHPAIYNTLPLKNRRQPIPITNPPYPCAGIVPMENNTKCYRTMYFVPYNGLSDPTYQNIQRILPPHSSPANYANHIERYPYPRNREDQQLEGQTPPRYYVRPPPGNQNTQNSIHQQQQQQQQQSLHLHLHQPEDFRFSGPGIGMQTLQLQHHQHISQLATYNVQSVPAYTVMAPSRTGGFAYPVQAGGRAGSDVQTQTISLAQMATTNSPANVGYNNGSIVGNVSSSSSTSSVLSSPTKIRASLSNCTAERGVPEGAASAPAHDFGSQANCVGGHGVGNAFLGHANNVPPPNTQNSVYYAMNV